MKRIKLFEIIPFNQLTKSELFRSVLKYASIHKKTLILNMNAYGVVTYLKNKKYSKIINKADVIYPDGWGPVIASKFFSEKMTSRINVGDFIFDLFKTIEKMGIRIYILGGKRKTLQKSIDNIKWKYPTIKISGYHHGFNLTQNTAQIIKKINASKPNIVFVGLGIPKQEVWIDSNWKLLPNAVYMGVGSVFEYVAGKSRAPIWMRNSGFEWVYRLAQEPSRLFRRYTMDNLIFVSIFIKNIVKQKLFKH